MAEQTARLSFVAADEAATLRCAAWLAHLATSGMYISLVGDLGAGKTAFARGFIRAKCGEAQRVPSPTFTLVQPYDDAVVPIWHADLYRLAEASEVEELGLLDALATHICLIEWADKADGYLPSPDVSVALHDESASVRRIDITASPDVIDALRAAMTRDAALADFIAAAGWSSAQRVAVAGDASTRRYERLTLPQGDTAIIMDWATGPDGPPVYGGQPYSRVAHLAEAMPAFCDMVDWLRQNGLVAPRLLARDEAAGFALLQDFGDRHIAADADIDRAVFYHEAVDTLLHLHARPAAPQLPVYDGAVQAVEAGLFLDWYLPWRHVQPDAAARAAFTAFWQNTGDALTAGDTVTVLRDYHSVNLLWRSDAQARFRIGLIDVQDALQGHAAYDLASLLCDARLDVDAAHHDAGLAHYCAARFGGDAAARHAFEAAYALCAVQRNLKIAGIFIRLAQRDKKPGYLRHMPRILSYLKTHLAHPALHEMAVWFDDYAPHVLTLPSRGDGQ